MILIFVNDDYIITSFQYHHKPKAPATDFIIDLTSHYHHDLYLDIISFALSEWETLTNNGQT